MLSSIDPAETLAWKKLTDHFQTMNSIHMKDLFAQDSTRFATFSKSFEDILLGLFQKQNHTGNARSPAGFG